MKDPLPPSFSWQLLPASPSMKEIRNTGRCLKRWGTRLGFRGGTSSATKARVLAARFIHTLCVPRTQTSPDFSSDAGRAWSGGTITTFERESQPYNVPLIGAQFALAMSELATGYGNPNGATEAELAAMRALDSIALYTDAPVKQTSPENKRNILGLFRAFASVSSAFEVSEDTEDLFGVACDRYGLASNIMLPVRTEAPWQIAAMRSAFADEAEWTAASFAERFLC